MLGYIWALMILVSICCSVITGRTEALAAAIGDSADQAIKLLITMAGTMCLWTGMMKIADKSGVTAAAARLLSPLLGRLMPDYAPDSSAMQAVCANVTANIFGLGNAATPLGIKTMQELQKENRLGSQPNRSMIMFVVLNTASVQLIPVTAAALRKAAGSSNPYSILPAVWLTSAAALTAGIVTARLLESWFPAERNR